MSESGLDKARLRTEAEARADGAAIDALARQLFTENNRKNGALLPDGFGFLGPNEKQYWRDRAMEQIGSGGLK